MVFSSRFQIWITVGDPKMQTAVRTFKSIESIQSKTLTPHFLPPELEMAAKKGTKEEIKMEGECLYLHGIN